MPQIASGNVAGTRMKLNVGGVERRATSTSSYAYRLTQVNFTYTVVAADVDADGISIPANSIIISGASWAKVAGGFVNFNHSALSSQSAHRVYGAPAYLSATNPASLTEANLNGATVTVSLGGLTFASGVSASSFQLVTSPAISGLSISNVTGGASGSTSATLTLATASGFDFDVPATLAVRVLAAAHSGSTNVTTGAVSLTPTDEAPSFGSGSVPAKTFFRTRAIAEFQVPAASGGNGALAYSVSGLPAGLVFDADGTGSCPGTQPREVCGTPTAATSGAQTVTVTVQDADANRAAGDRDTLTFQVTVFDSPTVASNPATLTEANLNGARLTVTLPSGFTFASGVSASSFALATNPAIAGLTISNVTGGASGATTATLTLATGAGYGFNTPSTLAVRVRAAAHSGSTDITSATLAVSPTPGITLSRRSLTVQEDPTVGGGTTAHQGTYTVVMDSPPTGCSFIIVNVASDNADVTTNAGAFSFSDTSWSTPQMVTVTAAQDADNTHDTATLSHSIDSALNCPGAGYTTSLSLPSLTVNVNDDEAPRVAIASTSPASLTEANLHTATVAVALTNATFASDATASSFALLTDIRNVSVSQVSGGVMGTTSATLTLSFTGDSTFTTVETLAVRVPAAAHTGTSAIATGTVNVTPTPGIALSRTTLALEEDPTAGGGTNRNVGTYTVALTADPTTASGGPCGVNLRATSNNADATIDTDSSPLTKRPFFDGTNWSTPQTVTVTAAQDANGVDDVATIGHRRVGGTCSGGFFGTPTLPSVTATVNDDETPAAAIASPTLLTAATLNNATLTVSLERSTYASGVTAAGFELVTEGIAGAAVSLASATATPGGTSATLTLASSGTGVGANATLAVKVLAAAHAGDADLTTGTIDVLQGADTAPTFGASVPTQYFRRGVAIAPFQIPAATGGNGAITYASADALPPGLKFDATGTDPGGCTAADFPPGTAATWATAPRTICGTPTSSGRNVDIHAHDADSNRTSSDRAVLGLTILVVSADITSTTPSTLTEGSLHGATVALQLDWATFASGVTAASFELVTAIPNVSISGVSGGALNSRTATLTLAFTGDFDAAETLAVKVLAAAHNRSGDLTTAAISVTPTDTTPAFPAAPAREFLPGVAIAPFQVPAATNANGEVTYTVAGLPAGLKLDVSGTDAGGCTAADFPTGTAATWATAPLTVCGTPTRNVVSIVVVSAEDEDGDTASVQLRITVAGPAASIAATSPAALAEGGLNGATLTVSLARTDFAAGLSAARFALVTTIPNLSISGVAATGGGAVAVGATEAVLTLAFTGDFGGTRTLAVRVLAAAHSQSGDLTTGTVDVTATAGVTVGTESLALNEPPNAGTSGAYTLVLDAAPPSTCSLTIGVTGGNADVAASPGSLTFTDANWDTPQTVTVTASADADSSADADTLAHSITASTCTGYPTTLSIGSVAVTVADADVGATLAPGPAALTESNLHGATLTLTLDNTTFAAGAPGAGAGAFELVSTIPMLTITQVAGVTSGGTTATLTLGFTGDFRGQPTVAVRVPAATHQGTGALTSNAVEVTANAGVTVSESSLSLDEDPGTGGSAHEGTYTVVLDSPPTGCALVRIDVASDDAGVTVSPAMLSFRRTGSVQLWSAPQTVTVTAGQDDDGADVAATVSHSVGLGYSAAGYLPGMALPSVAVAVSDDEAPGVVIDADPSSPATDEAGPLALTEGHATEVSGSFTVRLAAAPTQDVTVTLASADTGAVSLDDTDGDATNGVQDTLTFTSSDWGTAQTVTARAADDADGGTGLSALGVPIPASLSIHVHEEGPQTAHLVLPSASRLGPSELEAAAGSTMGDIGVIWRAQDW